MDCQKLDMYHFIKQSVPKIEVIRKCQQQKCSPKLILLDENKNLNTYVNDFLTLKIYFVILI